MGEAKDRTPLDANYEKQTINADEANWVGFLIERYSEGKILCIDTLDRILHFCFWDEDSVAHIRMQREDILSHLIDNAAENNFDGDTTKLAGIADRIISELTTQAIQNLPEFIEAREVLLNKGFFNFQNGSTIEWNPLEADFYKNQYAEEFLDKSSILTPYIEYPKHCRVSRNDKH
ncbi:hypothetical protein NIES37_31150 [Tolypothrix tenuis PCC 7101]|uniref:Uncharacterized protein n=1 Tax=Tolypothrix tenuis PCC 7101 TaxID=231146 RepID=A0A1Z4N070_9CYAN|nr:hypothetical protein [Aulosira sp. FACHB-113]BAY99136.1 hypothetical protein NIES37_31150 [Tolypothrix tenuis PCC 7101]BAZ76941.1 hypothetical protein NIES50_55430 [Aulosira laxa NIES-50]